MTIPTDFTTEIVINNSLTWENETRNDDVEKDYFSTWIIWVSTTVAITSSIFGSIGNATTIFAYKRNRKLQTSFNHLVLNQCVLDLFFSLLVLPFIIPLVVMQYQIYSESLCKFVDYLYHAMTSASVINLVFIATNRYVGIVHSSRYRRMYSSKEMRWWLIAAWISSPLLYLPFILNGVHNQLCSVGSESFEKILNIYNAALQNSLKLLPTIVLILLYRAIFMKVKKSRKLIEHHPLPGSVSHTNMDPDFEGSSRLRTMRRYSSSRIRRTESLNTQKASGSPQNANKSSTMAYLQVPDAKPAASFDLKTESELSAKDCLMRASSSHSLDSQSISNMTIEVVRSVQSTPEIYVETNIKDDSMPASSKYSKVKNCKGDVTIDQVSASVSTSERHRRRMQDMKNLHILSTIDSESYSRSVSCENAENCMIEERSTVDHLQNHESNTILHQILNCTPTATQDNFSFKENDSTVGTKNCLDSKFSIGSENKNYLSVGVLPSAEKISEARPTLVRQTIAASAEPMVQIALTIDGSQVLNRHLLQSHCGNLRRLHSMSCADIPDDKTKTLHACNSEEASRRHSISMCSDSQSNFGDTISDKAANCRRIFKTSIRKRKKHHSSESEQSKTRSSKIESFAGRRIKSETYRTVSRPWKRHWKRKTNPPNIKIVIEQATSEDTVPDPSESMRPYTHNYEEIFEVFENTDSPSQDTEPNNSPSKALKCKKDSFKNSLRKSLMKRKNLGKSYSDAQASVSSDTKLKKTKCMSWSKSAESLPSLITDRHETSKFRESGNDKNYFLKPYKSNGLKLSNPALDKPAESSESKWTPTMDERRSSITSQIYRYNGNDDNLSRNGSFSHTSYIDDCRRRNNNSPMLSRENSVSRRSVKQVNRKQSFYNWNRRKSFFSSFNSGNTTESRRQRRRRDAEKHIAYNGVVICVAFAIIALPSYVVGMTNAFVQQSADAYLVVAMLSWLHVVINPTIYGYMNPQFRAEYKQIWRKVMQNCNDFIGNCTKPDPSRKTSTVSNSHYMCN